MCSSDLPALLSDNKFHNVGVPTPPGQIAPELGRYPDIVGNATRLSIFNGAGQFSDDLVAGQAKLARIPTPDLANDSMKGQMRTPTLLNVAETAPYFHTGSFPTLEEVVNHYDRGGGDDGPFAGTKDPAIKPLHLTDGEKADLVAFLRSLTGTLDPFWTTRIQ